MILAFALAVGVLNWPLMPVSDARAAVVSLHEACLEVESRYECVSRVVNIVLREDISGGCIPQVGPPDMYTHTVFSRLANWIGRHPETAKLSDKDAVRAALEGVYPCGHRKER